MGQHGHGARTGGSAWTGARARAPGQAVLVVAGSPSAAPGQGAHATAASTKVPARDLFVTAAAPSQGRVSAPPAATKPSRLHPRLMESPYARMGMALLTTATSSRRSPRARTANAAARGLGADTDGRAVTAGAALAARGTRTGTRRGTAPGRQRASGSERNPFDLDGSGGNYGTFMTSIQGGFAHAKPLPRSSIHSAGLRGGGGGGRSRSLAAPQRTAAQLHVGADSDSRSGSVFASDAAGAGGTAGPVMHPPAFRGRQAPKAFATAMTRGNTGRAGSVTGASAAAAMAAVGAGSTVLAASTVGAATGTGVAAGMAGGPLALHSFTGDARAYRPGAATAAAPASLQPYAPRGAVSTLTLAATPTASSIPAVAATDAYVAAISAEITSKLQQRIRDAFDRVTETVRSSFQTPAVSPSVSVIPSFPMPAGFAVKIGGAGAMDAAGGNLLGRVSGVDE